jgi:nucleoid-associated protein YgaU
MAAKVLTLTNLSVVSAQSDVQAMITAAFQPLVDSGDLEIDFTGAKAASATYELSFDTKYEWTPFSHRGCLFKPLYYGVTGTVNLDAIERKNFCEDVTKCGTCERLFRSKDEVTKQIGITAVHEIGHLFGLHEAGAYKGADSDGHSGDPDNFMFAITKHIDYKPIEEDSRLTTKYTIVKDDWLSKIAHRIGFWPDSTGWQTLYKFKGKDGKANKELLRSGNPNLIFPGEQIWVPDIPARIVWNRELHMKTKSFTTEQIDTMRAFVKAGKTIFN